MAMHYGLPKWLTEEDSDRPIIWALTVPIKEKEEVRWRRRFVHDLMAHKYGQGTHGMQHHGSMCSVCLATILHVDLR
jgi:hypothetical protein